MPHLSYNVLLVGGFIAQSIGNLYVLYRLRSLRHDLESVQALVTR